MNNNANENDQEISDGLLRQRRNLIILSLIIPLFFLETATVEQINLFGTLINLKTQSGLKTVLFTFFIYFLWRYWQYFGQETRASLFRSLRERKLYDAQFKLFSDLMKPISACFEYKHYHPSFKNIGSQTFFLQNCLPDKKLDKKVALFKRARMMEIYGLPDKYENHYLKSGENHTPISAEELALINKSWKITEKSLSDSRAGAVFETAVEYNTLQILWINSLVRLKFVFSHPYFSDYQLPFIIAGISFLTICIYVI